MSAAAPTTDDAEEWADSVRNAKRRRSTADVASTRVILFMPAGVCVPAFYTAADADAQQLSDALRVGATAVQSSVAEMASMACARLLTAERDKVAAAHTAALRGALADAEAGARHRLLAAELEMERARMQRDEVKQLMLDSGAEAARARDSERAFFQAQLGAVQAALSNVQQEREHAREQAAESAPPLAE